ncbi:CoA transferase subunit A [Candidatus Cloacimonas acidaminovorans]|jgi:3-oxoacid CoA-transferase A subunit|uniref:Acetoacetate:butyrate CoA-transferase alpha subunit n=1 Tax=Cloacimonas acidaminovorans (strain Evry) TaxID=459349 RepID=B0VIH1_CLOAI|nr:CoA transferase subunit A [Candidatus Cloacimonas acidaminovorans]NLM91251.1 CoA transferase subunit A [Candidatus Cloacimonadota bacterium]MDY0218515.1 CoA transferase subunit A [Candidatus Cloacimonas acidaminovorans]CAO79960.1 Acetoacetate:butyrate CoA-transferase alpha subunit [Candidatus Cloacimonas acidaminovorans str. Evry]HNV61936.1 CoA transferase subunit A [Candidatus Cloacimonas acidaminovorans]HNZ88462.1 CoA transferase subunit A [Candidatus Cloacimonas acidaminovorans]
MVQIISAAEAAAMIKPGNRLAIGGFLAVGAPETIIDAMVENGNKDLHIIVIASDWEDRGVGKLVVNKMVKSAQVSHMGTNKTIQAQMNAGEIDIELVPQGTLMERVRAFGAGLGGILTPTGLGTIVAEGKQIITVDGKDYLLETAIPSDFALIKAHKADKLGNLTYRKTARNSNPIMAMAGKITIAEVDEIVEIGELDPEEVITPGVFVNYLVLAKEN